MFGPFGRAFKNAAKTVGKGIQSVGRALRSVTKIGSKSKRSRTRKSKKNLPANVPAPVTTPAAAPAPAPAPTPAAAPAPAPVGGRKMRMKNLRNMIFYKAGRKSRRRAGRR